METNAGKTLYIFAVIKPKKSEEYEGFFLNETEIRQIPNRKDFKKYTWIKPISDLTEHYMFNHFLNYH